MRDEVTNDGRSQETFNQQLTVPPTSHRRPVFSNQTNSQFARGHVLSSQAENDTRPVTSQLYAQVVSPQPRRAVKSIVPGHSGGEMGHLRASEHQRSICNITPSRTCKLVTGSSTPLSSHGVGQLACAPVIFLFLILSSDLSVSVLFHGMQRCT